MNIGQRQCFRCGKEIIIGINSGQVTISGFFSNKTVPYYNSFNLCEQCHVELNTAVNQCLFSIDYSEENK